MPLSPELELERRAHELRGRKLHRVQYQHGREIEDVDSIEHLVFLDLDDRRYAVGCSDELRYRHGWGITVKPQKVIDTAYGAPVDVSASVRWAPRIGKTIAAARIHWDSIEDRLRPTFAIGVAIHADHLSRLDFPQTLEIDFGGGDSVFFAAARRSKEEGTVAFVNQLLVFFSRSDREAAGL